MSSVYKKFSSNELNILRQGIFKFKKDCCIISGRDEPIKGDLSYNDYKMAQRIEKKLVHVHYLDRSKLWTWLLKI